jgi:hypothetical protein
MKMLSGLVMVLVALTFAGCATGPETALSPRGLKGDHMIYFEQSDRVPKDVLLAAHGKKDGVLDAMGAIPPEIIEKVIEEAFKIIPDLAKSYSKERMYNALIGRRMLFRGYESPEQLKEINEIIKSMGNSIEYLTPQDEPKK